MKSFPECKSFDWDEGNINKNWDKHRVHHLECEEIFLNEPIIIKAERAHFPNLRPSSRHISIRLPERLFEQLRNIAHQKDIPCQSLMKVYVAQRVKEELKTRT